MRNDGKDFLIRRLLVKDNKEGVMMREERRMKSMEIGMKVLSQ